MRRALYRFYSACQRILAPGLRNSQYAYKEALTQSIPRDTPWLDLGCGHMLFPDWMPGAKAEQAKAFTQSKLVVGIDYDFPSLQKHEGIRNRVRGDIQRLPFADGSFGLVSANVVIEHVEHPDALLAEIRRVLKPGGIFLFHTPNLLGYATLLACLIPQRLKLWLIRFLQGRAEEDVFPVHYRLNTSRAVAAGARRTAFAVQGIELLESSAQAVMLGPVVILELLWIRLLRFNSLRSLRTNIIAHLQKLP
jgi:SAM-dependent methyltransferase